MPARAAEIEHAEQEGVRFHYLASPVRYIGDQQRWVRQMQCLRMKLGEADESGRRRPIPMLDSTFLLDVDMVVVAVGAGPNRALFEGAPGLVRDERGYIRTFTPAGRTSLPRVWAGGDIVTGAATVILAMGAARKAADDIHVWFGGPGAAWLEEATSVAGAS
jgi:glutamate synthase (NADPH) small chain